MATLVAKVRGMTGSSTTESSNVEVGDFLRQGANFVISGLPEALMSYFTTTVSITSSTGAPVKTDKIVSVKRDGVECERTSVKDSYAYSTALTATSFKDVTTFFPVYWQQTSNIFIKPDPTTAATGTIAQVITPGAVGTTDTTWVLDEIDGPALKYAASLDAGSISSFFVRKGTSALATVTAGVTSALAAFVTAIPTWSAITATTITTTQMADALTKAQNLIDNLTSYDVESYLADDDPEIEAKIIIIGSNIGQIVCRPAAVIEIPPLNLRVDIGYVRVAGSFSRRSSSFGKPRDHNSREDTNNHYNEEDLNKRKTFLSQHFSSFRHFPTLVIRSNIGK